MKRATIALGLVAALLAIALIKVKSQPEPILIAPVNPEVIPENSSTEQPTLTEKSLIKLSIINEVPAKSAVLLPAKSVDSDNQSSSSTRSQTLLLNGRTNIPRTDEQVEQLGQELELWEIMMSSEYAAYSKQTLQSLAEQGDPIAFHQLIANGEISVEQIQRLANQLGKQGYPMVYGFAADGIYGSTKDKILAMAYFMAAVKHGSELMRQFELDYTVWFKLEDDELAIAAELAEEL